ncbi:zinc finger, CCHC-type containing protein [Tanacetum coccineum]
MVEHNNSSLYDDNKGKCKHHDNIRADPKKKAKPTCWKCGKNGYIKMDFKVVNVGNKANGSGTKVLRIDDVAVMWMTSGATELFIYLRFNSGKIVSLFNVLHVPDIRKNFVSSTYMSTSKLNDSILWHVRMGHVHFKKMQDMSKDGSIPAFDMDTENDLCDLHATLSVTLNHFTSLLVARIQEEKRRKMEEI